MDLERGRQLSRTPYSAARRALSGGARLLYNTATHPAAIPFWSNLARRWSPVSPPASPRKRMRGRSLARRTSRSRSRTRSSRSRGWSSGRLITNQNDYASRFVGSSRRRRGSRAGRRFRYRVLQTVNANQPLSVYTVTGSARGNTLANEQSFYGVGLYTTQMSGMNDIQNLMTDAGINLATAAQVSSSVIIKSACLDVQIRNNGSVDAIVDIYEVLNVRDTNSTATIASLFTTYFGQMTTITASSEKNPAVSVFENPQFCRHFKVLKKTETTVPAGDVITMQMRNGKDKKITASTANDYQGCIPKLSKFYFFMWHGIPEWTGTASQLAATDMVFSYQKSYKYALNSGRTTAQVHNA